MYTWCMCDVRQLLSHAIEGAVWRHTAPSIARATKGEVVHMYIIGNVWFTGHFSRTDSTALLVLDVDA